MPNENKKLSSDEAEIRHYVALAMEVQDEQRKLGLDMKTPSSELDFIADAIREIIQKRYRNKYPLPPLDSFLPSKEKHVLLDLMKLTFLKHKAHSSTTSMSSFFKKPSTIAGAASIALGFTFFGPTGLAAGAATVYLCNKAVEQCTKKQPQKRL